MTSNTILFVVIGLYLLVVLTMGVIGFKKRKKGDISDYYHGGRSFSSFLIIMTFWASLFSAFTFIGLPGFFYTHGIGTWAFLVFGDMLFVLGIFFFGKKIWQLSKDHEAISPIEVLTKKYGSKALTLLAVLVTFIFMLPILAVQIAGVGKLVSSFTGGAISFLVASAFMVLIIYIYSELGGMRSLVWTDAFQAVFMFVIFFIIAFSFLNIGWGGSLSGMFQSLIDGGQGNLLSIPGPLNFFTYAMLISFFFLFFVEAISIPYISQRLFLFKNKKVIRNLLIAFPILVFLITIPAAIIGLGAASMFPGLASGDLALSEVLKLFSNPLFAALAITGIIAAAMSTTDSQLLVLGSILSRDVYKKFFNNTATENQELKWSRIFILLAAILAFAISVKPPQLIVQFGILSIAGLGQLVPAYIAGLSWKKATKQGAIASILVGVASLFIFQYLVTPWFGFHPGFLGIVLGSLTIYIVSKFTYSEKENYIGIKQF